jgi:hypothetical protein
MGEGVEGNQMDYIVEGSNTPIIRYIQKKSKWRLVSSIKSYL